jgi:hypothetical protein
LRQRLVAATYDKPLTEVREVPPAACRNRPESNERPAVAHDQTDKACPIEEFARE